MPKQEIIEGKELIAEFMGGKYLRDESLSYEPKGCWRGITHGFFTTSHPQTYRLKYNSSWDWLMPVVHKCIKYCHDNMLEEWEQSFSDKFMTCDIMVLFNEVVKFIKWYNTQK